MDDTQLNFNQPILSVRRGSAISAQFEVNHMRTHNSKPTLPPLPFYKSDLKSGPVTNPGVVPFQWEHKPGRPMDENIVPNEDMALKLPPGRIMNHEEKQRLDKTMTGSPSSSLRSRTRTDDDNHSSESDDENVIFVDARETLSRTESLYNCSVSGVSVITDMSCSRTFSDPQTRDFMMGRFLPAAKAMASETSHFTSRRHFSTREQSEPVTRVIKWKKQYPRYILPPTSIVEEVEEDGEEEEEEEDEFVGMEDTSAKFCGLLPKFCMLNPIPGMRGHTQAVSSVRSVHTRPPESFKKSEKKDRTDNHIGDLKRLPHRRASSIKPSMRTNFGSIKDGSPQLLVDIDRQFIDFSHEPMQNHGGRKLKDMLSNPAIEKTVYMDFEHKAPSPNSIPSPPESRGRNPSVDSLQDHIKSHSYEKQISQPKSSDTNSSLVSTPEKSFHEVGEDFKRDQDFKLVVDVREDIQKNRLLGLAPFLPKSPSESWLARTLHSNSNVGHLAFRASLVDRKGPSMFRTSNFQPMGFPTVEELEPIVEN